MESSIIQRLLEKGKKTLITIGSGGVGKTTCSIAMAISAARLGYRVGLLSIDPAKRLAAAMGMHLGVTPEPIVFSPSLGIKGTVEAAMLDQKAIFDRMVRKFSSDPTQAEKILQHQLYVAASTSLAGSLEYMALASLQEMVDSGRYDLIVLDTPPDTNALEFLNRPNVLSGFMEHGVMHWLVKPFHMASKLGFDRLFSMGERLMGGIAKVTGFHALKTLAEFLVLIQHVIDGFHMSGEKVIETLHSSTTGFILVTSPNHASLRSAKNLYERLGDMDYKLDAIIFNKTLPQTVAASITSITDVKGLEQCGLLDLRKRADFEAGIISDFIAFIEYRSFAPPLHRLVEEQSTPLHNTEAMTQFSAYL